MQRAQLLEVVPPAERFVQRAPTGTPRAARTFPRSRRPRGVGNDDLVAGLEQRLTRDVQAMDPAVGDHDLVRVVDRNCVLAAQLIGQQLTQSRQAGGLQVVGVVVRDGPDDRILHRLGRIEADVALIETKRLVDGVHHVADADDAGEWDRVKIAGHGDHWGQVKGQRSKNRGQSDARN